MNEDLVDGKGCQEDDMVDYCLGSTFKSASRKDYRAGREAGRITDQEEKQRTPTVKPPA